MTITFCSFLAGHNIQYTFLDITSPIIGISFLLILLRLSSNKQGTSTASNSAANQRSANYPLRTISVNVAKHVDVDSDIESRNGGKGSYGGAV